MTLRCFLLLCIVQWGETEEFWLLRVHSSLDCRWRGAAKMNAFPQSCKTHQYFPLLSLSALRLGPRALRMDVTAPVYLLFMLPFWWTGRVHIHWFRFLKNLRVVKIIIGRPTSSPQALMCSPIIWKHSFCLHQFAGMTRVRGCPLSSNHHRKVVRLRACEKLPLLWCPLWPQWPRWARTPEEAFKACESLLCSSLRSWETNQLQKCPVIGQKGLRP